MQPTICSPKRCLGLYDTELNFGHWYSLCNGNKVHSLIKIYETDWTPVYFFRTLYAYVCKIMHSESLKASTDYRLMICKNNSLEKLKKVNIQPALSCSLILEPVHE